MAFTHKILLCYSIILLLAVLARSNKSVHESMPSFDDTYQLMIIIRRPRLMSPRRLLTIPPAKYHTDNGSPPSKLDIDTHVSPPRHNDSHDSTALPDHDGNDGYEGMLPNNYTVTGAESVDNCYGPCSQIPYPSDCPIFCVEKGYRGGFCMPQLIIRRVRPDPTCCCFGK
ncbi:hypothetical protein AAC387_Pa12g1698 [Persea americana]